MNVEDVNTKWRFSGGMFGLTLGLLISLVLVQNGLSIYFVMGIGAAAGYLAFVFALPAMFDGEGAQTMLAWILGLFPMVMAAGAILQKEGLNAFGVWFLAVFFSVTASLVLLIGPIKKRMVIKKGES